MCACSQSDSGSLTVPTTQPTTVPIGSDVTLAPGQAVIVNPDALQVTFVGVTSESRCPTNALIQCVWAGSAKIALNVASAAARRDVSIETQALHDTVTVDRYLVQLVSVMPAPVTLDPIPPSTYRATVRITRT